LRGLDGGTSIGSAPPSAMKTRSPLRLLSAVSAPE
jgi:hypothetical protein